MLKKINPKYAETLLDSVFEIIIALSLLEIPKNIGIYYFPSSNEDQTLSPENFWISMALLASALIFTTFYWLEVKQYIDDQKCFYTAINDPSHRTSGGLFLGLVFIITVAAAILLFSKSEYFPLYIIANIIFWLCDLFGTIMIMCTYKEQEGRIVQTKTSYIRAYNWFIGHVKSKFFIAYGTINICVFLAALYAYLKHHHSEGWKISIAVLILLSTIVCHLIFRTYVYFYWIKRFHNVDLKS